MARGEAEVNRDGDMVQLGYFSQASSNDLFQGDWVPLTAGTTFGDSSTLAGADGGIFHFSTLFEVGTDVVRVFPDWPGEFAATSAVAIEQSVPGFGKLLAIRFYDGPSIAAGVRYNTVAHPEWKWGSPMVFPFPINIQLSSTDAELVYQDADHPAVASIVVNPDTDNASIHMVSGNVVGSGSIQGLGKYETGAKAALPVFKKFVSKVVKKKDALPFKVPKSINLVMVDVETGLQANDNTKKVIYESFKAEDNFVVGLENSSDKNRLGVYDSNNQETILRFY